MIEVLKQALEALESYYGYMEPLTTVFGGPRVPAEQSTTGKVEQAIISLRQAIAEAEKQEPVAWRAPNWGHSDDEWVYRDFDDPVLIADGKPSPNNEPLYTSPPAQEFVCSTGLCHYRKPLTHEQRFDLLTKFEPHKNKWEAPAILIDMVEAAHGIKGEV